MSDGFKFSIFVVLIIITINFNAFTTSAFIGSGDIGEVIVYEGDEVVRDGDEFERLVGSDFELRFVITDNDGYMLESGEVELYIRDDSGNWIVDGWTEDVEEYQDGFYALFDYSIDEVGNYDVKVEGRYEDYNIWNEFDLYVGRDVDTNIPYLNNVIFESYGNLVENETYDVYVKHGVEDITACRLNMPFGVVEFVEYEGDWSVANNVTMDVDVNGYEYFNVGIELVGTNGIVNYNEFDLLIADNDDFIDVYMYSVFDDEDSFVVGYTEDINNYNIYRSGNVYNVYLPTNYDVVVDMNNLGLRRVERLFGTGRGHRVVVSGLDSDASSYFMFSSFGRSLSSIFSDIRISGYNDFGTLFGLLSGDFSLISDYVDMDNVFVLRRSGVPHQIEVMY